MLFNSLSFILFLLFFLSIYWLIPRNKISIQNLLILIASYLFYSWWDWRFLSLIFLSTIVDFYIGILIYNSNNKRYRKSILLLSIVFNLGLLAFFKYYNFFIESWAILLSNFGYNLSNKWTLSIILPVGISFYTFQTMSYSLDIYFKKIKPTFNFIAYASFVSFFPQLVAGPIERAKNLIPQFMNSRSFSLKEIKLGLRLILWGLFKKVVIADNLGFEADYIFNNYTILNGGVLLLGLAYFSFQIYCDFSGYSDIAIGISKLFGFELISNFNYPYFSKNIKEFWTRWHISLSSFFKDYLYFNLGGSKKSQMITIRNILIVFLISGLWHGAKFTFIIWGLVHSIFYVCFFITSSKKTSYYSPIREFISTIITYLCVMFAWVFFRANSFYEAIDYLFLLFNKFEFPKNHYHGLLFIFIIVVFDWIHRNNSKDPLNYYTIFKIKNLSDSFLLTKITYISIISIIFWFIVIYTFKNNNEFIYYQF